MEISDIHWYYISIYLFFLLNKIDKITKKASTNCDNSGRLFEPTLKVKKGKISKMKSMFGDMLDNSFIVFLIIYGLILWTGFAITHDFMWFNFFDYLDASGGGSWVFGIYILISTFAYLYGLFALIGILWDILKLIGRLY